MELLLFLGCIWSVWFFFFWKKNKELRIYEADNFPFFYVPKKDFKTVNLNKDINIYIPSHLGCWANKTPCGGSESLGAKKILGFSVFFNKNKEKKKK